MTTPAGFSKTADLPVISSMGSDDYLIVVKDKSTTPVNRLILASNLPGGGEGGGSVDVTVLDRILIASDGSVVTSGGNVVYSSGGA